jgi:hypothetical protein
MSHSALNAYSKIVREDRGDAIPAIRFNASCGMTIQPSAVFALPGSVSMGSTPRPFPPRARPCRSTTPACGCPPSNETTPHRMLVSPLAGSIAVKTCVPIGRSAYRSLVEASSTPTICRLSDSRRHQLWAIAPSSLSCATRWRSSRYVLVIVF